MPDSEQSKNPESTTGQRKVWYVMRSLFNTELKTQAKLEAAGIRTYLPMHTDIRARHGRQERVHVPLVRNLLFVCSDPQTLQPFLLADSKFQYTYRRGGQQNESLVVPDEDMERFIRAVEAADKPLFFAPEELNIEKGTRIRIHGGVFDGLTGLFMKVRGARAKRLVVVIPDTLAVAVEVSPEWVEIVSDIR